MTKLKASNGADMESNTPSANFSKSLLVDMCNAATQTEKVYLFLYSRCAMQNVVIK